MLFQILFYIFLVISLVDVIHMGLYLVGANVYDYRSFVRRRSSTKSPRIRPQVSLLIPAHNEDKTIIRTLDSVRRSYLRKLEIIVIDDCSTDKTRQLVRDYITAYPHRDIKLLFKRRNVGKAGALNHGLRHAKGELVMMLDADSVIHPTALSNAVRYFNDPSIVGVAANVRIVDDMSVLGLLQKFEYLIGYRSKKFFSAINGEYIVGGVGSMYRMETLKKVKFYDDDTMTEDIALSLKVVSSQGNKASRIIYGADVVAMTEPVGTFKALLRQRYRWKMGSLQAINKYRHLIGSRQAIYSRSLSLYRLPMAVLGEILLLLEPLAIAFAIYVTIHFGKPTFLLGAYSLITLFIMINVWPDEYMSVKNKLKLSLLAPAMYFVFYIMNIIQLAAIMRCLKNKEHIFNPAQVGSAWVSPKRDGQSQVQFG